MTIKVGDRLPEGHVTELVLDGGPGCPTGPQKIDIHAATAGKKIAIFSLPGAFTPTCSAAHAPGYVALAGQLQAKGVDEIWCLAANDAFVMAAWGQSLKVDGKVRMMADGSANYARKLGLELDLTARDMGVRIGRASMLVEDGVVRILNVEAPGKFEVSGADTLLAQI